MISFLNMFYKSIFFKKINPFVAKKLFKIFKIFFVKTSFIDLPQKNYKLNEDKIYEEFQNARIYENNDKKPYITYTHLLDLISVMKKEDSFNFFDYGAGNLNLFFYLNKKIKHLNYFFFDQEELMKILKKDDKVTSLSNLNLDFNIDNDKYDLVYFGSSFQYLQNYEREILKFKKKTKYLLISQTPFFKNKNSNKKKIVLKQINMHPNINYLYSFSYDYFINYMKDNNFR